METLIEQFKDRKAQLAGAIMEEDKKFVPGVGYASSEFLKIGILEAQAELYQAMIELAQANLLLQESINMVANLQKNHETI